MIQFMEKVERKTAECFNRTLRGNVGPNWAPNQHLQLEPSWVLLNLLNWLENGSFSPQNGPPHGTTA
jgi:hypothetical protein